MENIEQAQAFIDAILDASQGTPVKEPQASMGLVRIVEELRQSAERYDWLKENIFQSHWDGCLDHAPRWSAFRATGLLQGKTLEEAIDNAIKKEKK